MDPDEVVQGGESEVGGAVAEVAVDVADADELLQLLPLLAAAHVVQQAGNIIQRGVGKHLLVYKFGELNIFEGFIKKMLLDYLRALRLQKGLENVLHCTPVRLGQLSLRRR